MESKKVDLNMIDPLFNPTLGDEREIGDNEIKAIYGILIEMLPEEDILFLISILQSFKEDAEYVKKMLIEDSKSNKVFFQKISKAFEKQHNYKNIIVYNSILHIEDVEYQQYFYDELNNLKIVLQDIIKETIFFFKKEDIDTSLNKTIAIIIQQLTKTLNLVITKKGKSLFCDGNIKETLVAITELIAKSNSKSISTNGASEIINTEVIAEKNGLQIHSQHSEESNRSIMMEAQRDMMRTIQEVISKAVRESVSDAMKDIESKTEEKIKESAENLKNILIRDNDERFKSQVLYMEKAFDEIKTKEENIDESLTAVSRTIEEVKETNESAKSIIENHVQEQDRILDKYRALLKEKKRYE